MITYSNSKISLLLYTALLVSVIVSAPPFMFYRLVPVSNKVLIALPIYLFTVSILYGVRNFRFNKYQIKFILLLFPQLIFFIIQFIYLNDSYAINGFIQSLATIICLLFFIIFFKKEYNLFYKYLLYMFCAMIVLSLINFILVYVGVHSPYEIIFRNPDVNDTFCNNYILGFTNSAYYYLGHTILRIAGYLDEPGALAFYIVHFMFLNNLTIKSKKVELILIIGGLFTFTLAFYISLILYLAFIFDLRKISFILMVSLPILLALYSSSPSTEEFLNERLIQRFELSENPDRILKGDNRSPSMILGIGTVVEKPFMGYGYSSLGNLGFDPSSIVGSLAAYGFIGIFCKLAPFLLLSSYCFKSRQLFMMVFIMALNYIQRPNFCGVFIILIYYGMYLAVVEIQVRNRTLFPIKIGSEK